MTRVFCYLRTIRHGAYRPRLLWHISPRVVAVKHDRLIPLIRTKKYAKYVGSSYAQIDFESVRLRTQNKIR